jgi:D-alanyl-lipoteichoic acid acyltransferase DltB (MBOAT superfamily)
VLFSSYVFIFFFLPISLGVFFYLGKISRQFAAGWLASVSLFFYGWWNPAYVGLLLASICFNYALGMWIAKARVKHSLNRSKHLLAFAITANLSLLCYYKYSNFFLSNIDAIAGTHWIFSNIILPLGISFFTFTQIAFLVDAYKGEVKEYNFIHYGLFVTYFPHLIAGPILHHKEMIPQFCKESTYRPALDDISVGLSYFVIGLCKKVILADGISTFVTPVFGESSGEQLSLAIAWGGALAYTLQLYFDFSGYTDMAVGISRMFGVRLPLNFNSPYKAVNIVDFWRRWHMTLSRFLRDYLYIPLGGNKKGSVRRYINLMITMLLGGLWHGAGWTFVIWGGLHGAYLIVNHGWQALHNMVGRNSNRSTLFGEVMGRLITFLAVVIAWVFFRAETVASALSILSGMMGLNGITVSQTWLTKWVMTGQWMQVYYWIAALLSVALFMPNSQTLLESKTAKAIFSKNRGDHGITNQYPIYFIIGNLLVLMTLLAIINGAKGASEFIYFNF